MPRTVRAARARAFASSTLLASASALAAPALAADAPPPIETIVVIGWASSDDPALSALEPTRDGRLSTLKDLFRSAPGVLVEPVFGGVDHPRFAIRGSGLQRGTMPAGRGIDLRLDGLPMSYGDGSFDFVEWIEPLAFGEVRLLRGGRGARGGGAALGGIVDFRSPATADGLGATVRGEAGSYGMGRGQAAISGGDETGSVFLSGSWYGQSGFRRFNAQEAWRANGRADLRLADGVDLRTGFLFSDSRLELPGPQTLAQIEAGSRDAQPGNVLGDWRRRAQRLRGTIGLGIERGETRVDADVAFMATDVDFRRRDVQVEENRDWSGRVRVTQGFSMSAGRAEAGIDVLWQDGARYQQLFLNGGGTMMSFSGAPTLMWADNDLDANRLSAVMTLAVPLGGGLSADLAAGHLWTGRTISDRFPTGPQRSAATYDRDYRGFIGSATLSAAVLPGLALFAGASRSIEAPTFDMLMINRAGTGMGAALVSGPDPRRPVIVDLDAQRQVTVEAGVKGAAGPVELDITLYRAWLEGEIVSTADFVSQTVSSVGNAGRTTRWGVEAKADASLAAPGLQAGDRLGATVEWTFTDARFADDARFGSNRLPILPPHLVGLGLDYGAPEGGFASIQLTWVPEGGFADYANSLKADGYLLAGGRIGWRQGGLLGFVEGRNLFDRRHVSSVIAAQNNLGGMDAATFAPGEGRSVAAGVEIRF